MQHHGIGTPDLGLGAFRSAKIANQILGKTYFEIEGRQSFQDFQIKEIEASFAMPAAIAKSNFRTDVISSPISKK